MSLQSPDILNKNTTPVDWDSSSIEGKLELQSVAYIMRLTENFFELPNVVEDSNLPEHLPDQCSEPVGARGPLAPASSLSISRAFYDPQQTKLPWMHVESA